jgi:hypothetical protein
LGLSFALLALYALQPIWDLDVFWEIAAGRAMRLRRGFIDKDVFSAIAPERAWISQHWAYQLGVDWLDRAAGLKAVHLAHAAVAPGRVCDAMVAVPSPARRRPARRADHPGAGHHAVRRPDSTRPAALNFLFECILIGALVRGPAALDGRVSAGLPAAAMLSWLVRRDAASRFELIRAAWAAMRRAWLPAQVAVTVLPTVITVAWLLPAGRLVRAALGGRARFQEGLRAYPLHSVVLALAFTPLATVSKCCGRGDRFRYGAHVPRAHRVDARLVAAGYRGGGERRATRAGPFSRGAQLPPLPLLASRHGDHRRARKLQEDLRG